MEDLPMVNPPLVFWVYATITPITTIMITPITTVTTRWEEMSISGEKDTMDFQPLTQFLKCYAIYFAS